MTTLLTVGSELSTALLLFLQHVFHQLVQVSVEIRQLSQAESNVACLTRLRRAYSKEGQRRA
jgi:hypothetical protein